jgi:hypothetical protein
VPLAFFYKGIADQQARVNQANQTNAAAFGNTQDALSKTVADRTKAEKDAMKAAADKAIADGRGLHGGPQAGLPDPLIGEDDSTYWNRATYTRR